jgi:hypothetical protein
MSDSRGEGLKFDGGKIRPSLLPIDSLTKICEVLEFGAKKYKANSWQTLEDGEKRYMDALLRHLFAYMEGEELDPETGLPHLSHAGCNILFLLHLTKEAQHAN